MPSAELDVAILGGGPAASACAASLRQILPEASIAIFDSRPYGSQKWYPGETLSPGANSILESLGFAPAFREAGAAMAIENHSTAAAWGSAQLHENDFVFSLHGSGWRLDRMRFDRMLLDCVEASGVRVHRGVSWTDCSGSWQLGFADIQYSCRFVVDATGRSAAFAVRQGSKRIADDRLAGVFVLFDSDDRALDTLIEAAETGWWYSTSVPGSTTVAGFMTDSDLIRESRIHLADRWSALLTETSEHTRERLRGLRPKAAPVVVTANSQRLEPLGGPGWVATGDAATAFDPLSSHGIVKALRSGKLASFVAADFLRGVDSLNKYQSLAEAEYAAYARAKREYYSMEGRWRDSEFWFRRR